MNPQKLSNQALWYLTGLQKTYTCSVKSAEPKAMRELQKAGLVEYRPPIFNLIENWSITKAGLSYKID